MKYHAYTTASVIVLAVLWMGVARAQEGKLGQQQIQREADKNAAAQVQAPAEEGIKEMKGNRCPVMGMPINKAFNYAYKGTQYYFCCASCAAKFKANPEEYINKMKK